MQIEACRIYHAKALGRTVLRMPDGRSVFKVYYVSAIGRERPGLFEWRSWPRTQADFEKAFLGGEHEGVGFAVAFPHITKQW